MTFDPGAPDTELPEADDEAAESGESSSSDTPQEGSSWTDALPDGSGSDGSADTGEDTASGGSAD